MPSLDLHAALMHSEGDNNSSNSISPLQIVIALLTLSCNVYSQRKSQLATFAGIEQSVYRVLRLLPLVAALDAIICFLALSVHLLYASFSSTPLSKESSTSNASSFLCDDEWPADEDAFEKKSEEKGKEHTMLSLTRIVTVTDPSKRPMKILIAVTAGLQLWKLSAYQGVPFSIFCGRSYFGAFVFHELLHRYVPDINVRRGATREPKIQFPISKKDCFVCLLVFTLIVTFVQISWLGQYLVPRTLWMHWGPPPNSTQEHLNLTFPRPPCMPDPVDMAAYARGGLVVLFRPGESRFGKIFYGLHAGASGLLLFITGLSLGMILVGAWMALTLLPILVLIVYVGINYEKIRQVARTDKRLLCSMVRRLTDAVESCFQYVQQLPHWLQLLIRAITILGILAISSAYITIVVLHGLIHIIEKYNLVWLPLWMKDFLLILFYLPEGTYTSLVGTTIMATYQIYKLFVIGKAREGSKTMTRKSRRLWLATRAVWLLAFLSGIYFTFYYDATGTHRLVWVEIPRSEDSIQEK